MSDRTEVLYIHETLWQSIARDVSTFLMLASVIGLGWWMQSSAMQWAGFIMCALAILNRVGRVYKKSKMSPQEAADRLYDQFGVTAQTSGTEQQNPSCHTSGPVAASVAAQAGVSNGGSDCPHECPGQLPSVSDTGESDG